MCLMSILMFGSTGDVQMGIPKQRFFPTIFLDQHIKSTLNSVFQC
jgi:hypothetical protein